MKILMNMWPYFLFSHVGDYFANTEIASLEEQFQDMHFFQVESVRENILANIRSLAINAAHKLRFQNKNFEILQPLFNLQCASYLSEDYIKKIRPDVIFAHSHIPRVGNKNTVPLVAVEYLSSKRYMEKVGVLQCLERDIEAKRWATERANVIVTTTPESKKRFEEYIPETRGRLMQIPIYMPYLEPITEEEIIRKANKDGFIRMLFIGGAARRKGLPQVLRALRLVPNSVRDRIRLTVVSNFQDGPVPGLELATEILSNVSRGQLSELLRTAHIFVFPTQFESYGRVIVEAMANGCAVISSNTDPQDWILDFGRSGILINPESVEEIAAGIEMLTENRRQLLNFAISACRRFCSVFHHNVTGKQYRYAFDSAIKN
jgi:glycosyltransferase involved in cell wall biosynthesis